jgi:hypothetical protein
MTVWTRETLTEQLFVDLRNHIHRTDEYRTEYSVVTLMGGLRGACKEFLACNIDTTEDLLIMASLIVYLVREITLVDQEEQSSASAGTGVH